MFQHVDKQSHKREIFVEVTMLINDRCEFLPNTFFYKERAYENKKIAVYYYGIWRKKESYVNIVASGNKQSRSFWNIYRYQDTQSSFILLL